MKRVIVWGCGNIGKTVLFYEREGRAKIIAYTDSNNKLWNKMYCGIPIIEPKDINNLEFDFILISIEQVEMVMQIKNELLEIGIPTEKIKSLDIGYAVFSSARYNWLKDFSNWLNSRHIKGSVAECGVFRGNTARFMNDFFSNRKLYLFDTFNGFNENDVHNEYKYEDFKESNFANKDCFKNTSIELVMKKMNYPQNVYYL